MNFKGSEDKITTFINIQNIIYLHMESRKSFHKSLLNKKGASTEDKVIGFIVVGAIVGIGVPILYGFFTEWALNTDMPSWLVTAGPAFIGIGVLILIVGLAKSRK